MQSYTDLRSAPTRCITILCHFKEYLPNISLFWKALHIFNHSSLRSQVYFQVRVSSNAFKKLRRIMNVQNFKIKICCIIWFSYPFLTSGRLTQFLMRGVPLVFLCIPRDHQASRNLQTLRIQRSALYANFPPTLRQHACSQYKAKVIWWYTAGIFQLQDQSQRQNGKRKSLTSTKVQKPRKDFTR